MLGVDEGVDTFASVVSGTLDDADVDSSTMLPEEVAVSALVADVVGSLLPLFGLFACVNGFVVLKNRPPPGLV